MNFRNFSHYMIHNADILEVKCSIIAQNKSVNYQQNGPVWTPWWCYTVIIYHTKLIAFHHYTLPHCPGRVASGCSVVHRGAPQRIFQENSVSQNLDRIDPKPQWNKDNLCPPRCNFGKCLPPLFINLECTPVRFQ